MNTELVEKIVARWHDPEARSLYRKGLISDDNQLSAQADILHHECGWSHERLREEDRNTVDKTVAETLGISRIHSNLLRYVNEDFDCLPSLVLTHPERIVGPEAPRILKFWNYLHAMTKKDWAGVFRLVNSDNFPCYISSNDLNNKAISVAGYEAWKIAYRASAGRFIADTNGHTFESIATTEIQAHRVLERFSDLPLFGFETIADLDKWELPQ